MSRIRRMGLALLLPCLLAGCQRNPIDSDPFLTAGTWKPTDMNDANLREMVNNPQDLAVGQSASTSRGQAAAVAVRRLLTDKLRPLNASSTSVVGNAQGVVGAAGAPLNE